MYTLKNKELSVSILDPVADVERLGSRYCTGGYIYQVVDSRLGELLAGPQYPDLFPDTFDGQGAPDMFLAALGADTAQVGDEVGCIGVGRVRRTDPKDPFDVRRNREVIEFLPWTVTPEENAIQMETDQAFQKWAYHLTRRVSLNGRKLSSYTQISNQGESTLPVRWFAHPFFPLTEDHVLCHFSSPVSMPENPGYVLNADGYICRKADFDWSRGGWFQALEYEKKDASMTVLERHPKVGQVVTVTDFMPTFLPIWGNQRTFSFEPYFEKQIAPGGQAGWSIEYSF